MSGRRLHSNSRFPFLCQIQPNVSLAWLAVCAEYAKNKSQSSHAAVAALEMENHAPFHGRSLGVPADEGACSVTFELRLSLLQVLALTVRQRR